MLPLDDHKPKYLGFLGKELDVEAGRDAARIALAVARKHIGSLDGITRVIRLGIFMATSGNLIDQPRVADGASDLFRDVFGPKELPVRLVIGVSILPLGVPVELEVILEMANGQALSATQKQLELSIKEEVCHP